MTDSPATASARRVLDIFVIVDTSNSMRRCDCAGIDAVSRALRKTSESFHDIVRSHDIAVNMAVLAFDDDARWVVSPQPVETVTIPALTTGMLTRLDRACIELETYLRGNSLTGMRISSGTSRAPQCSCSSPTDSRFAPNPRWTMRWGG